jgi:hypothetical protein
MLRIRVCQRNRWPGSGSSRGPGRKIYGRYGADDPEGRIGVRSEKGLVSDLTFRHRLGSNAPVFVRLKYVLCRSCAQTSDLPHQSAWHLHSSPSKGENRVFRGCLPYCSNRLACNRGGRGTGNRLRVATSRCLRAGNQFETVDQLGQFSCLALHVFGSG